MKQMLQYKQVASEEQQQDDPVDDVDRIASIVLKTGPDRRSDRKKTETSTFTGLLGALDRTTFTDLLGALDRTRKRTGNFAV
jgi:hypothetical protein